MLFSMSIRLILKLSCDSTQVHSVDNADVDGSTRGLRQWYTSASSRTGQCLPACAGFPRLIRPTMHCATLAAITYPTPHLHRINYTVWPNFVTHSHCTCSHFHPIWITNSLILFNAGLCCGQWWCYRCRRDLRSWLCHYLAGS